MNLNGIGILEVEMRARLGGFIHVDLSAAHQPILLATRSAEELFGYAAVPGSMVGLPIHALVPDAQREQHHLDVERYTANPTQRAMGYGRPLRGQRKDGSTFACTVSIGAVRDGDRLIGIALIMGTAESGKP